MQEIHLRPLGRADAPVVTSFLSQLGYPAEARAVADAVDDVVGRPDCFGAIAQSAAGAVGLVTVVSRPSLSLQGTVGIVAELFVRPDARGQGIGARLLRFAKGLALAHGFSRLETAVANEGDAEAGLFLLAAEFEIADARIYHCSPLEGKHPRLPARSAGPARRGRLIA